MVLSFGALSGILWAASAVSPAGHDLPAIQARGTLRVIFATDARPETINLDPALAPGLERELIEGFAAVQRLKTEFVPLKGGPLQIPALLEGKGDVIVGGMGATESRRKLVDFTSEVFPSRNLVMTRRPHPVISTLQELRQVRVGTVKASSWSETIATLGIPRKNVDDSYAAPGDLIQALHSGKVAAIVLSVGWALMEQRKDPEMQLGLFVGRPVGRAWAVRKDAPELRKLLDEYVTNLRHTSTWNRLVVKYYGANALEVLKKAATP